MTNIAIFLKLFLGSIVGLTNNNYSIALIDINHVQPAVLTQLKQFESQFKYPFSNTETFTIEHGLQSDYFSFFKGLGTPYYYIATCNNNKTVTKIIDGKKVAIQHKKGEIAAAMCCILRTIAKKNGKTMQAWYICDLKVNEKYQGEHLPLRMAQKIALQRFVQCPRGFGICMNPPQGEPKAASIVKKHGPLSGVIDSQTLNLYTLTADQVNEKGADVESVFKRYGYMKSNQQLTFTSTHGNKDYQIFNAATNNIYSWDLLHMQPSTNNTLEPHTGATHMLCAIEGTALDNDLKRIIGSPSSTALIVSYGMKKVDFNFLTSNQI